MRRRGNAAALGRERLRRRAAHRTKAPRGRQRGAASTRLRSDVRDRRCGRLNIHDRHGRRRGHLIRGHERTAVRDAADALAAAPWATSPPVVLCEFLVVSASCLRRRAGRHAGRTDQLPPGPCTRRLHRLRLASREPTVVTVLALARIVHEAHREASFGCSLSRGAREGRRHVARTSRKRRKRFCGNASCG